MTHPKFIVVDFEFFKDKKHHKLGVFGHDTMDRLGGLDKDTKQSWHRTPKKQ
jgi:hypothetical protein